MDSLAAGRKGLPANSLKYIAIAAMLIDHIAWAFVPFNTTLGQVMHIIGRLTAPIMCFFIAEGYYHTRNLRKYMLRLGIFAVISHFAFVVFEYGDPFIFPARTSVIYTLFLGLLALAVWNKLHNSFVKVFLICVLCFMALFGDWLFFAVLYVLAFGINHGNFKKQIQWFCIVSVALILMLIPDAAMSGKVWYSQMYMAGVFLVIPLLVQYNGQLGKGGKFNKWLFYIFYPLHLFIIGILKFYIFI